MRSGNIFYRILKQIKSVKPQPDLIEYWRTRTRQYGRRSVLNIGHTEGEFDNITAYQKEKIFPVLAGELQPSDKTVLDFGCGAGRFSEKLAVLTGGTTFAIDPIPELLQLAPQSNLVKYFQIKNNIIPLENDSVDLAWICLVLGGIPDHLLNKTTQEIRRVLKPGGLMCLVENTSRLPDSSHWFFREPEKYIKLFNFINLEHKLDYNDLNERISVFTGRKQH